MTASNEGDEKSCAMMKNEKWENNETCLQVDVVDKKSALQGITSSQDLFCCYALAAILKPGIRWRLKQYPDNIAIYCTYILSKKKTSTKPESHSCTWSNAAMPQCLLALQLLHCQPLAAGICLDGRPLWGRNGGTQRLQPSGQGAFTFICRSNSVHLREAKWNIFKSYLYISSDDFKQATEPCDGASRPNKPFLRYPRAEQQN